MNWIATCSNGSQITLPTSEIPVDTVGNLRLAAVWSTTPTSYTISYNLNEGVAGGINPTAYDVTNGSRINTNTLIIPTMLGYKFSHWMVVFLNGTTFELTAAGIPAGSTGNIFLAAMWESSPVLYEIEYQLNGGVNAAGNPDEYSVRNEFPIEVYEPTKAGYLFQYWLARYYDGTQTTLPAAGITAGTTGKIVLTAIWNPNPITYSITYDLDGGDNNPSNIMQYDVTFGQISIANPTRVNYTFLHWMVTYADSANPIQLGISGIPAGTVGNIKLTAVWKPL
jgi:uncharacterized repeat protein (TIGR02543 family)